MSTVPPFYLSVAARTDVGRVRKNNEDAFVVADLTSGAQLQGAPHARFSVGDRGVLLAVSDGMGGAQAGEVASAIVVETLTRALAGAPASMPREALMNQAVQEAHCAVRDVAARESKKMGATLTAMFVHGGQAYVAEVGDSRAYLIREGRICQLTRDQNVAQQLVDAGAISREEADSSPLRSVVIQAMGIQREVKVALARLELRHGDCLMLCSDGLPLHATDEDIRDIVLRFGRPEIAVRELVDFANARGGSDNITVVVAGVGGFLSKVEAGERITDTFEVIAELDPPKSKRK